MSCFQPQLAQFMPSSFQKLVEKMCPRGTNNKDQEFWIEEKLDGERIQMHMEEDDNVPGGYRFKWWSRKGKDYTYLYGDSFEDDNSALTRHMKNAFNSGVSSIILDGEMITWDPVTNKMVAFGTLKTAAISGQKDPFSGTAARPVFKVFDCLYLNEENLTKWTLKDRRNALEQAVNNVEGRIEKHDCKPGKSASDIDPALRKIVAEGSEGLVLKNPRSTYRLNSRNDDWMKVKPEYMTGFGESLDCIIIGGYYGSGHRGGNLSSFLCGLRVDNKQIKTGKFLLHKQQAPTDHSIGANPMKCFSFFKVGGGFNADDYAAIRHQTEGKWIKWDAKSPPTEFVELAGSHQEKERPDVWIKPDDSIVVEVKAASVGVSDSFRTNYTLRFPRFKRLRPDKDWKSALSIEGFMELKAKVEEGKDDDEFKVDKKKRTAKRIKTQQTIAGTEGKEKAMYEGPNTGVFKGMNFCVMSEMIHPSKKSKVEIETMIKNNGGQIFQSPNAKEDITIIADKRVVKVASLIKIGKTTIVKPQWVLDAVAQMESDAKLGLPRFVLPFEKGHVFYIKEGDEEEIEGNTDQYGDSYTRDITAEELKELVKKMGKNKNIDESEPKEKFNTGKFLKEMGLGVPKARMFQECTGIFILSPKVDFETKMAYNHFMFAAGDILKVEDLEPGMRAANEGPTHIFFADGMEGSIAEIRKKIEKRKFLVVPRYVSWKWIQDSWTAEELLGEEGYEISR